MAGVAALALVRVAVAAHTPIIDDEGYYWLWSRHLGLSYLDHPPLVAWLDAVATAGGRAEWLLRLPAMLATLCTTLALYLLGRDLFDRTSGLRAAALHLAVPVFAVQAIDAIPDPLLYAWWTLAMWAFWRALRGDRWGWWACGLALGLGLLSKESMVVLSAAFLVVLAWPSARRWWRTPGPYVAGALAGALAAPILIWNAQHGWAALGFWLHVGGSGGPPAGNPPGWGVFANTATQFAYGGPLLFPAMVWALWRAWRLGRGDERFAFLVLASVPTLLLVAAAALLGVDRPNWPAPAYLAAVVALGALWPGRVAAAALGSSLALSLAVLVLVSVIPWVPPSLRWDELYGWREVTAEIMRRAGALHDPGHVLLVGQRYNEASYFGYYAAGRMPVSTGRTSEFAFWAPPNRYIGWQGIAAIDAREAVGQLRGDCARLLEQPPYRVAFPGGGARAFRIFRCVGFRGTPRAP
ncbi:MAG TPA: glycosyltransferase family 39 protein [bacterium]|nr:glycosyltransferase family 39 protein [bacterium]